MFFSNAGGGVIGSDRIASMETLNSHHGITVQILPRRATGLVPIRQTIWTTPYHTPGTGHDLVVEIDLSK